ncbi:hypothetical protein MNV49_003251, partial [Pseudohyphozyma bogoriensis]
ASVPAGSLNRATSSAVYGRLKICKASSPLTGEASTSVADAGTTKKRAPVRKGLQRSRNGCLTCRKYRQKCDEDKLPECKRCRTSRRECVWPDHVVKHMENAKVQDEVYNGSSLAAPTSNIAFALPSLVPHQPAESGSNAFSQFIVSSPTSSSTNIMDPSFLDSLLGFTSSDTSLLNTLLEPSEAVYPDPQQRQLMRLFVSRAEKVLVNISPQPQQVMFLDLNRILWSPSTGLAADALRLSLLAIGAIHEAWTASRQTQPHVAETDLARMVAVGKNLTNAAVGCLNTVMLLTESGGAQAAVDETTLHASTMVCYAQALLGVNGSHASFDTLSRPLDLEASVLDPVETTTGVSRAMWHLFSKVICLVARANGALEATNPSAGVPSLLQMNVVVSADCQSSDYLLQAAVLGAELDQWDSTVAAQAAFPRARHGNQVYTMTAQLLLARYVRKLPRRDPLVQKMASTILSLLVDCHARFAPPSLVTLPVTAPLDEILAIIRRDGGIIIKDFLSQEEVDEFDAAAAPLFAKRLPTRDTKYQLTEQGPMFHATNTTHLRGMLGTMPEQTSKICQNKLWNGILHEMLKTEVETWNGDELTVTETSHILSLAAAFKVGPGAEDQILHRDQSIHSVVQPENSLHTTDFGCLIAGTNSTKTNGATRVIPGSHLWGAKRGPKKEEAVYAEMERGSALFWCGSTYHGASANVSQPGDPDSTRILYGFFGCQDFLRQEENQYLSCPENIARTLPLEVLRRAGWFKSAGGCGNLDLADPYVKLGFPQATEA